MKKSTYYCKLLFVSLFVFPSAIQFFPVAFAQQLPYYTQYVPSNILLNPAVTGTKRLIDARMTYRMQWVGFDDAPVTKGINLNSRFLKGMMGAGVSYVDDITGPTRRSSLSLMYAYHLKFDDVELSAGISYGMLTYSVDGTKLNMYTPQDNAINLSIIQKKKVNNAGGGILFYNDRFHIGFSVLSMLEPSIHYYPVSDLIHKSNLKMVRHYYGNVGYNWSGQPDWIWENSLQALYVVANPILIDYNLRVHYRQKVFGGISVRLGDAVALHVGATFKDQIQVSYSYDVVTSSLRAFQSGSHEIMIAWSTNLGQDKKHGYNNNRFKKQKYGFMF